MCSLHFDHALLCSLTYCIRDLSSWTRSTIKIEADRSILKFSILLCSATRRINSGKAWQRGRAVLAVSPNRPKRDDEIRALARRWCLQSARISSKMRKAAQAAKAAGETNNPFDVRGNKKQKHKVLNRKT